MKLLTRGKEIDQLVSVNANYITDEIMYVKFNTKDKWINIRQTTSFWFDAENNYKPPPYFCFIASSDDEDVTQDYLEIILIAENEKEASFTKNISCFELKNKDQIEFIFTKITSVVNKQNKIQINTFA